MDRISDMLKGVDAKTIEKSMEKAKAIANTKEGKAFIQKYQEAKPTDKDELVKIVKENPELIKLIENFFKA